MAVIRNKAELINLLFESGADVSCLNQEFIEKYQKEINQETKDLIAKIQEKKNIKKREEERLRKIAESLKREKMQQEIGQLTSRFEGIQIQHQQLQQIQNKQQQEIEIKKQQDEESKKQLIKIKEQQELQKINQERIQQLFQEQQQLFINNKQQIDNLQLAINQQLASAFNDNINPRFLMSPQDLAEIKYIQNNPELNDYYCRMQKCFNEAFLFAMIVSQGGTSIEEQSKVVNSLENISDLVGDIPFASLIVKQFKYGASLISKAKTKGQQGNFSDIVFTADPIESSLLAERIARRFTTSRELNEEMQNQIIANALEIKDKSRIEKMKIYLKEQAEKLAKYLGVDQNLQKGFLGQELSVTNQLALSDFAKAVEFIFNEGISPEIKSNLDETDRHQEIAEEIVLKAIELEVQYYESDQVNQGSTPQPTPIDMMELMRQRFAEIEQRLEAKESEIEELKQQLQQSHQTLTQAVELEAQQREIILQQQEQQINRLDQQRQDDQQIIEQQLQMQQKERKKHQEQISKLLQETKEIQTNQDKLKKLAEIADFAPNLEINISEGSQAKTMKLGDLIKDQTNKKQNLEQNLGDVFFQIQNRLEDLQLQIENQGERYNQRPSRDITEIKSGCCVPVKLNKECKIM